MNEKVEETKKISPNPAKQDRQIAQRYLRQTHERNSYSKTDNDATFMRMKRDSKQNSATGIEHVENVH